MRRTSLSTASSSGKLSKTLSTTTMTQTLLNIIDTLLSLNATSPHCRPRHLPKSPPAPPAPLFLFFFFFSTPPPFPFDLPVNPNNIARLKPPE